MLTIQNSQGWIVNPAQHMGFKSNVGGICYGLAFLAAHFIMTNDVDSYADFINLILNAGDVLKMITDDLKGRRYQLKLTQSNNQEDIIQIINLFNKEVEKKIIIKPRFKNVKDEKALRILFNSVPAFYNIIELYFQAEFYPEWFQKGKTPFYQNYLFGMPLVIPNELKNFLEEDHIDLTEITHLSGKFERDAKGNPVDLIEYVNQLLELIKSNMQAPITLILESGDHAITLGYHPRTKELIIANANPPPLHRFQLGEKGEFKDQQSVAKIIETSFFIDQNPTVPIMFTSIMLIREQDQKALEPFTNKWKSNFKNVQDKKISSTPIDETDPHGFTLLSIAVKGNDFERVKYLLQNGADPNFRVGIISMLYIAAEKGFTEIVELLLQHGAHIETGRNEWTPLCVAAINGHHKTVEVLIKHKANINALSGEQSPLYHAIKRGFTNVVEVLLKHGALAAPRDDIDLLFLAADYQHDSIFSLLLDEKKIDISKKYKGLNVLFLAAQEGLTETVRKLLKDPVGATMVNQNSLGKTALYVAAVFGYHEIVELLLQHHADPNMISDQGDTALHVAAENGQTRVVECLLKNGRFNNIEQMNVLNQTTMSLALENGHYETVEVLLKYGAKLPANLNYKQDFLRVASSTGNVKMVKFLLEHGVTVEPISFATFSALELAAINNEIETVKFLLSKGADLMRPLKRLAHSNSSEFFAVYLTLQEASKKSREEFFKEVILMKDEILLSAMIKHDPATLINFITEASNGIKDAEINLNGLFKIGKTNQMDVLNIMFDCNVNYALKFVDQHFKDLNKPIDDNNNTLLGYYAAHDRFDVVEALFQKGAQLNTKYVGKSPLYYFLVFATFSSSLDSKWAQKLIDADLNSRETLWQLAKEGQLNGIRAFKKCHPSNKFSIHEEETLYKISLAISSTYLESENHKYLKLLQALMEDKMFLKGRGTGAVRSLFKADTTRPTIVKEIKKILPRNFNIYNLSDNELDEKVRKIKDEIDKQLKGKHHPDTDAFMKNANSSKELLDYAADYYRTNFEADGKKRLGPNTSV